MGREVGGWEGREVERGRNQVGSRELGGERREERMLAAQVHACTRRG